MAKVKKQSKETPLMKQYNEIKKKYPGALLLFRVGDFYETFGEDAIKASKVLDIVLTKRANGSAAYIELAGFPHHSLDTYLPKLVRSGFRVAICDQLEDPKSVKGIVKRGVTELVTPGLSFHDQVLDKRSNNYLASVFFGKKDILGLSLLDLSTGEFLCSEGNLSYIDNVIQSFQPSEIIYSKKQKELFENSFSESTNSFGLEDWVFSLDYTEEKLTRHFNTKNLKGYGVENFTAGICASGAILHYLEDTEHRDVSHILKLSRIEKNNSVWLDKFTIRNLELVYPQQEGGVSLIEILDKTDTPMGARLLKKWVIFPLKNRMEIEERHAVVSSFHKNIEFHEELCSHLKHINDLERLISKVSARRINPREFLQLKKALGHIKPIKESLEASNQENLKRLSDQLSPCERLFDEIENKIKEDAPLLSNAPNIIKSGVDEELDDLRAISTSGKDYLKQIKEREIERTGISSLKISYNRVFGYYLEVSNSHKDKVPQEWIRKQTLVNAERYITEELKTYEEKILSAEGKLQLIEQRIFQELLIHALGYLEPIQQNASCIAKLDCLSSLATIARDFEYVQPKMTDDLAIDIKAGRHPVIEQKMQLGEHYIPNDVFLDTEEQQIIIVTGPNMSGKSALLRQTALIVLMAQMGGFVPARKACIGIVDKVFTRVGASDNLSKGESTFMVEMTETASIMNNLSDRSLVLMDEIGRGTSTYDGVSIAWAIVEYLQKQNKTKAKTLFATHYHELNQLENDFKGIKNYNVSVKEHKDKIIFLRKLKKGGSAHSFGIHVAQLAGMPNFIISRANEILKHLEKDKKKETYDKSVQSIPANNYQLSLFGAVDKNLEEVKDKLLATDVNILTPIEAMMRLEELCKMMKEEEELGD